MEKTNTLQSPESISSGVQQHEDAVLKTSMRFFAEELLPYLGIQGKVVSFAPTELVHLELQKMFQDFNFIMEDGTWKHFEFQSTNEGLNGLKRFRAYEAITKEDLIPLVLCPLMSGKTSQKERISKAYHITCQATELSKEDISKIEAMIYAMADKFLDAIDLEKMKEEIAMTRLGQMIWEDGLKEGEERGERRGEIRGEIRGKAKGKIAAYIEMIQDGFISIKEAAIRLDITEDELKNILDNSNQ